MRVSCTLILALSYTFFCSLSFANVGDTYGYGSRTAALAGAVVATHSSGFSAYSNPAALSSLTSEQAKMAFSWSMIFMQPSFTPIEGVTLANDYTSGQVITGAVDFSDHKPTFGQALGFSYQLSPLHKIAMGLMAFLPVEQLARVDTGEVFAPSYPMYLSRTQRPQIEFALSAEAAPSFFVGAGIHLGLSLTSTVDLLMETSTTKPSSMRLVSSMAPKASPTLGLQWQPSHWGLGAVLRFASTSPSNVTMNSTFKPGFAPSGVDFRATAQSALYYDPASLELGGFFQLSPQWTTFLQIDHQRWGDYTPSAVQIEGLPTGATIQPSKNPSVSFQNIWIPRLAQEYQWGDKTLRLGYSYHPSIEADIPVEAGNLLDPPKHELNAGLGIRFPKFLHTQSPCTLDFHLAYHALVTQHVTKSAGDEAGASAAIKVGGPSYDAGGKIFGGGVSLNLEI